MEMSTNNLGEELEKIKKDSVHGATYLILRILDVLEQVLSIDGIYIDKERIIKDLEDIKNVHSEMIEFAVLLDEIKENFSLRNIRFLKDTYLQAREIVTKNLARYLIDTDVKQVLTMSYSSLIERGLIHWESLANSSRDVMIHVLESRPMKEGLILLKNLKRSMKRSQFTYWIDAAMGLALDQVDCVLLGMDRMYADGCVMNKVGSLPLAVVAREKEVPVVVVGTSFKKDRSKCPHGSRSYKGILRSPSEILDPAFLQDPSIIVRNVYFELIPSRYITKIITEEPL